VSVRYSRLGIGFHYRLSAAHNSVWKGLEARGVQPLASSKRDCGRRSSPPMCRAFGPFATGALSPLWAHPKTRLPSYRLGFFPHVCFADGGARKPRVPQELRSSGDRCALRASLPRVVGFRRHIAAKGTLHTHPLGDDDVLGIDPLVVCIAVLVRQVLQSAAFVYARAARPSAP